MEFTVEHHPAEHRFVLQSGAGEGSLEYALPAPGVIDLAHTRVDDALRGRGAGEALVRAALAHARERSLKVVPSCRFVRSWLQRHPEAQDLVAASQDPAGPPPPG